MTNSRIVSTDERHKRIFDGVLELFKREGDALSPPEQLAVMAQIVGMFVALQDQRKMTPHMAMEIVGSNLELGNQRVIQKLQASAKGTLQ
jgi:hypothetical protein